MFICKLSIADNLKIMVILTRFLRKFTLFFNSFQFFRGNKLYFL